MTNPVQVTPLSTTLSTQYPFGYATPSATVINNKPNIASLIVQVPTHDAVGAPITQSRNVTAFCGQFEGSSFNPLVDNASTDEPKPLLSLDEMGRTSAQSQTLVGSPGELLIFEFAVNNDEPVDYGFAVWFEDVS